MGRMIELRKWSVEIQNNDASSYIVVINKKTKTEWFFYSNGSISVTTQES